MTDAILVGTRGWDHADWVGGFYPEELPPEWRLAFYSNRLRAVLVPAETWDRLGPGEVREWAEDCDAGFRFVLEVPSAVTNEAGGNKPVFERFADSCRPIAALTAGYLLPVPEEPRPRIAALAAILDRLAGAPCCVDLPEAVCSPEWLECLSRHDAGLCWRPDLGTRPQPGGRLLVALARSGDPRTQRRILEQIVDWQGQAGTAALFFDTPVSAPAQAEQARLLAEIMGV